MAAPRKATSSPASSSRCSGELPWRAVPEMPVEIMLLPRWFPFHLSKVSYWSRTVIVPLLVLMAKKPRARNPRGISVKELFAPGTQARPPRSRGSIWAVAFNRLDDVLRLAEPHFPAAHAPTRASTRRSPSSSNGSTARTAWAGSIPPWRTR